MITIHDVAERAGVSIATVSNVINKTKKVSPATASKVQDALKELNYVPNSMAKSLKTNTYNSIGVIAEEISSFNTPPIIDAICAYFDLHGYTVTLCNLRSYSHSEYDTALLRSSLNLLEASRARGIIYVGANSGNVSHIRHLIQLPVVFAYCTASPEDHTITYDNFSAAKMAAQLLVRRGHRRIGLITGSLDQEFVHQRIIGFRAAMVDARLTLPPSFITAGDWSYELSYEQACRLLSMPDRPTAIFAMNDPMSCAVIAAAHQCHLRIPEDLSVIGFDDRSCSAYSYPSITTLHIPLYDIGDLAARSLLRMLSGEKIDMDQQLPCSLVERNSVGDTPDVPNTAPIKNAGELS